MRGTDMTSNTSLPGFDEYAEEIRDIWDTHHMTNMGPKHEKLAAMLKEYLGVENIELFTNGQMALELCLQAMKLKGEVITTPFSGVSALHAIVRSGLKPVFCDIDPETFTLDASKIDALINRNTCAVLPVHVYGNICDVGSIEKIAEDHGLKVIYDAGNAFGEKYNDTGIGNFGDAVCFSFNEKEIFNTIEGGAVCFAGRDQGFGEALYGLKNFGIKGSEKVDMVGANAKMNEFCAAMGICNMKHLNEELLKRRRTAALYRRNLENKKGIRLCPVSGKTESNFAYFPVLIDPEVLGKSRDDIYDKLSENGINAGKDTDLLTGKHECYKKLYDPSLTPAAVDVSRRILSLPISAYMEDETVERICDLISE